MKRVLIGSTIRQKPNILKVFLEFIMKLNRDSFIIDYAFVDDNLIKESSKLLNDFRIQNTTAAILKFDFEDDPNFVEHNWNMTKINRIANFKNRIIKIAIEKEYDFLF